MVLGVDRRVLALALARMVGAIANSFLIIVLPLYLGATGPVDVTSLTGGRLPVVGLRVTPELLIGVVLSLFGFVNSFSQPFTGRLSDRTGRRKVYILFGLAVLCVASAAYSFVESYYAVLVIRALQGLGAAFTIPVTVALVNELATSESRGGNFGVFNTFRLIGFGFGPLVAGAVVAGGPYDLSALPLVAPTLSGFDAAFGVAVVGAAASFLMVSVLVSDPEELSAGAGEDLAFEVRDPDGGLDPVFTLGVATVLMALGLALFATLANVVNTRLGQGEFLFSLQFAATVIANVLFQVPIGRYSDRYGRRPFIVAGFVLIVPTTFAQGLIAGAPGVLDSYLMVAARFLQGCGVALVFAPSLALAGDLAKTGESGSTLSILTMGFGLGTALGPLVAGVLVGFGFVVPFAAAAALGAVGLALVYTQVEETVETPATTPTRSPQD
jgi:MFS family permease